MDILKICPKLKTVWHFEIFVNTGPCGAGNFKTRAVVLCTAYAGYILCLIPCSDWVLSGALLQLPMFKFSKGCCSHSFHSISTKLYCQHFGHEGIYTISLLEICQN